jgi:ankyrin repeat protein
MASLAFPPTGLGRLMAPWDPLLVELITAAVRESERARRLVERQPLVLDLRTGLGETALHYLAVENYADAVQLLIDLGAAANVTNEFGHTALEEAELAGAREAAAVLRRAGAEERTDHATDEPS